jgi:hypothetical protein
MEGTWLARGGGSLAGWLREASTPEILRAGLLALAALGIVGLTAELGFLRHWDDLDQAIVWPAVGALAVAWAVVAWRPTQRRLGFARTLALAVIVVAGLGSALHLRGNLEAGPESERYGAEWDTMTPLRQVFLASTGSVGEAPILVPGALAEIALALMLATVRHPVSHGGGPHRPSDGGTG